MSVIDKENDNSIFHCSKTFSEDMIKDNFVRSIWFFNIHPTLYYMGLLNKRKSLSIIDSIFGHPPPIPCKRVITEMQYNWFAHCLRKLISPQDPTKYDDYKFFLSCLSKSRGNYATNISRFFSIRISRLKKSINQTTQSFDKNTPFFDSEGDEMIVFQALFDLFNTEPALFYSFRQCYINEKLEISTIPTNVNQQIQPLLPDHFTFPGSEARLIAKLGNRLLECCFSLSTIFLRAVKNEDIEELFGLPCVYSNPICMDTATQFQNAFFTIRRFPLVSFFANSSYIAALFNSSAVSMIHFVDVLLKPAIEFVAKSDFDGAKKVCSCFLEMIDYASLITIDKENKKDNYTFISQAVQNHFDILSTNLSSSPSNFSLANVTPNLSTISSSSSFSNSSNLIKSNSTTNVVNDETENDGSCTNSAPIIVNEMFQRFRGDVYVIEEIKKFLGISSSFAQLREQSIPKILVTFLNNGNFEPFEPMRTLTLFSVNDEDWSCDNDFISCFFALQNAMKAIDTNDEQFFENIEFHITQIQSSVFLSSLSVDIFSLLFLTKETEDENKKEYFFVNRSTAERILRILIDTDNIDDENYALSPYLSTALRKIQYANVLFPENQSVSSIMESTEKIFAVALERKEIGIFGQIAQSDEKSSGNVSLKKIVLTAKQVLEFQQQINKDFNSLKKDSAAEIVCSFELQKEDIQKLCSKFINEFPQNQIKTLLLQKQQQQTIQSSSEFLQFSFVKFISSDIFHKVSERLSLQSLENERNWDPLLNMVKDSISDKSFLIFFLRHLDTLVPPLLAATNVSVAKCLDFDPLIAVPQLVNEGDIEQASSLSKSLGYSVTEAIIRSGSKTQQCLQLLSKEAPVISASYFFNSKLYEDEIPIEYLGNSPILLKYFAKNKESSKKSDENQLNILEKTDFERQEGASKDEIKSEITCLLKKNPLPVSELSDVLLRITEDEFINITMNTNLLCDFSAEDFNSLVEICETNCFEKLSEIFKTLIETSKITKKKPFPLDQSLYTLIVGFLKQDMSSFTLAKRLCSECDSFFNHIEVIQKMIVDLSKQKKWDKIQQIMKISPKSASQLINNLPDEIVSKLNSYEADQQDEESINEIDKDSFFKAVPETWTLKKTPLETIVENASDTETVLWLVYEFPSVQASLDEELVKKVSCHADEADVPVEKRASSIAEDAWTFLPLMKNDEFRAKLVAASLKGLLRLASQLSIKYPYAELSSFTALKSINRSLQIIHNLINTYEIATTKVHTNKPSTTNTTTTTTTDTTTNVNTNIDSNISSNESEGLVDGGDDDGLDAFEIVKKRFEDDASGGDDENFCEDPCLGADAAVDAERLGESCASLQRRFKAAFDFVSRFPCTKFNVPYSLGGFSLEKTGELLAKLCFKLDYLDIAREISEAWQVTNYDLLNDDYALGCVNLGIDKISLNEGEYKGFEKVQKDDRSKGEKGENIDDFFYAWKFATDRSTIGVEKCCDKRLLSPIQKFIDAYRHYSFYDSRICTRLFDLREVKSILKAEFRTAQDTPSESEHEEEEDKQESEQGQEHDHEQGTKMSIFKNFFKSHVSTKESNDSSKSSKRHFYARLKELCTEGGAGDEIGVDGDQCEFQPSEIANEMASLEAASQDKSESLFPGTPSLLSSYLSGRAPFFECARYRASIGEFTTAIVIVQENLGPRGDWSCFLEDLLVPALERGRVGTFFNVASEFIKITNQDGQAKKNTGDVTTSEVKCSPIESMIGRLIKVSQIASNKVPLLNLFALASLRKYELAALTAAVEIKTAESRNERLCFADFAFAAAATSLNCPATPSDGERLQIDSLLRILNIPPLSDGLSPTEFLIRLLHLQRHICERVDVGDLTIFDGPPGVDAMIVFLFNKCEFAAAVELIFSYPSGINARRVGTSLVDIFINEEEEKIKTVVAGIEHGATAALTRSIVLAMVERALFPHGDLKLVMTIMSEIKNPTIRCPFLIQMGHEYLDEAFQIAKESCTEFLPLIANVAGKEGKVQLLADAVKAIEKNAKKEKK